jgi:CRISPR-associated endonuclease Cas1
MQHAVSPVAETFTRDTSNSGVCVADGYGIRIFVNRRHLVVQDGIGRHRRERRYTRAAHGLRRLVVLGHTGYVTLEAHRWFADVGVAYVHLDADGMVLATSNSLGVDHPALRRAQALAAGADPGLAITIELLDAKLRGQAAVAQLIGASAIASMIDDQRERLARAACVEECRSIEAASAAVYWRDAWSELPVEFVRRDTRKIPDHWKIFGSRQSALATVSSPRRATNPANALLNYLYALGEAEARLALGAVGLDPGIGFLHVDQRSRDSAALDVLEAIRPDIDRYVVALLQQRHWSRRDFAELHDGTCRILAPLTHELTETMPAWATLLAPFVERVAAWLAECSGRVDGLPTPLTQRNRSAGRRYQRKRGAGRGVSHAGLPQERCQSCGAALNRSSRRVCDECLTERRSAAGSLGRRGELNAGPPLELDARASRPKILEETEWGLGSDPKVFKEQLRPLLAAVTIRAMVEATGLSSSYCSRIRRGPTVPHPRHWPTLLALITPPAPKP